PHRAADAPDELTRGSWRSQSLRGCSGRGIERGRQRGETLGRALPAQYLDVFEHGYVGAQRGERAEEKRAIPLARERVGERRGTRSVHVPLAPVGGNGLEMAEGAQPP